MKHLGPPQALPSVRIDRGGQRTRRSPPWRGIQGDRPGDDPLGYPALDVDGQFEVMAPMRVGFLPIPLQEPLVLSGRPIEPVVGILGLAFIWFVLATVREEDRLRARGETQFPDVKRPDRRGVLARTDRVLRGATEELVAGYPVPGVLERLQVATHRGDALPPGRARGCYDVAVGAMRVGDGGEGAAWLRRARDELSKELMR